MMKAVAAVRAAGLRRPSGFCGAARSLCAGGWEGSGIAHVVGAMANETPDATALVVPHQGVRWSYSELHDRARSLASGFSVAGFCPGDAVMVWLPSVAENILVQLAAGMSDVRVATVKDADGIAGLEPLECKGIITTLENHLGSGKAAPSTAIVPPIVTGTEKVTGDFLRFPELLAMGMGGNGAPALAGEQTELVVDAAHRPQFFYNSLKGASQAALLEVGYAAAAELELSAADSVCLPITLSHSFGFGSGVLAAFGSGASLVLPAATPSAEGTRQALEEGCTVLYADTHTLKALMALEIENSQSIPASFRSGLVKVGSGDGIGLGEARVWEGRDLITVGNPPTK